MNGAESLAFKKADSDAKTEEKIMLFRSYLLDDTKHKKLSDNTVRGCLAAIKSFYQSERMPLTFTASEKAQMNDVENSTTAYKYSKEDLAKMVAHANLQEKYIVLCGASWGIRGSDMLKITFGQLRALHLDEEAPLPLGEIHTQKKKVKAFPFCSSDTIPIIKSILEENPEAKNTDRVLNFVDEQPLNKTVKRLFEKAGLEAGNMIVKYHELRAYLIDRLSAVASESQWKQICGKKIAESAYVGTDQLRDVYKRAMPQIIINGNGNGKNHALIEEQAKEIDTLRTILISILGKDKIAQVLGQSSNVDLKSKKGINGELGEMDTKTLLEAYAKKLKDIQLEYP